MKTAKKLNKKISEQIQSSRKMLVNVFIEFRTITINISRISKQVI